MGRGWPYLHTKLLHQGMSGVDLQGLHALHVPLVRIVRQRLQTRATVSTDLQVLTHTQKCYPAGAAMSIQHLHVLLPCSAGTAAVQPLHLCSQLRMKIKSVA